jgi:diguanylate cyclase (GGDEF)-like protein
MRGTSGLNLEHLPPLLIAAGTSAYLLLPAAGRPMAAPAVTALFATVAVLLVLHSAMALRLRQTVAFLTGLETAYLALVLAQSAREPLLGLGLPGYAAGCSLLLAPTLILIYALGSGPLVALRTILRVAAVVTLPLAWAVLVGRNPAAGRALSGWGVPGLPWPFALPQLGTLLLVPLLALVAARRKARNLHDLCLVASLAPLWILLEQAAHGARGTMPGRLAVVFAVVMVCLLYGLYRLFWHRVFQDELTGLGNRRSFEERLRFLRGGFVLAMLDIDHFKALNDTYGHQEGDNALRWVAGRIAEVFGARAFRYGGEEFAVILTGSDTARALAAMERLRRTLASSEFVVRAAGERRRTRRRRAAHEGGSDLRAGAERRRAAERRSGPDRRYGSAHRPDWSRTPDPDRCPANAARGPSPGKGLVRGPAHVRVTLSIGLAACTGRTDRGREVLERADQALYRAKREGRDRVVASAEITPPQDRRRHTRGVQPPQDRRKGAQGVQRPQDRRKGPQPRRDSRRRVR